MVKTALVIISDGVEDVEAVAPVDIMFRAGVKVTVAGLSGEPVKCAYGNTLIPNTTIDDIDSLYDAIVLPGGSQNADNLAANKKVIDLVKLHFNEGKLVAAICASPGRVLAETANIVDGKMMTGFPEYQDKIENAGGFYTDDMVTVDGNLITGIGPGAAFLFGLEIVEYLVNKQVTIDFARKWRIRREMFD